MYHVCIIKPFQVKKTNSKADYKWNNSKTTKNT